MGKHTLLPPATNNKGPRWTPLDRRFVAEYLTDLNATQAYLRAGGAKGGAGQNASRLLRKPHVRAAVDAELVHRERAIKDRALRVVEETYRQAVANVGDFIDAKGNPKQLQDIPEDAQRALASVRVEYSEEKIEADDGTRIVRTPRLAEFKLHDKKASQELFLKYAGKLKDKVELGGEGGVPISVVFNLAPPQKP